MEPSPEIAAGIVWGARSPAVSFYMVGPLSFLSEAPCHASLLLRSALVRHQFKQDLFCLAERMRKVR